MTTLDPAVFREAAATVQQNGLAKRMYQSPTSGRCCTVGALMKVTGTDDSESVAPYSEYLAELLGYDDDGWPQVMSWNDRPETTKADVVTLLDQAAEKLEAEL